MGSLLLGTPLVLLPLAFPWIVPVLAHEHHGAELTDEQLHAPVDTILWIHIALQAIVWGVIFPIGMVLGLTRSRWHVPVQVCDIFSISRDLFLIEEVTSRVLHLPLLLAAYFSVMRMAAASFLLLSTHISDHGFWSPSSPSCVLESILSFIFMSVLYDHTLCTPMVS